ncbi:MAG: exodeoxyribonuclease VII small subunit [Anaeroplasma sp.]
MENKTFEEYIKELDEILIKLNNKDISLEDSVNYYTKGLEISKKCYEILNSSEKLVVQKMTETGLTDF